MRWNSASAMILRGGLSDLIDDRLRHAGGREQPVEVAGDHAGKAGFDRGRDIRRRLDPRVALIERMRTLPARWKSSSGPPTLGVIIGMWPLARSATPGAEPL